MRTSIILEHDNRSETVDFTQNCRIVRVHNRTGVYA